MPGIADRMAGISDGHMSSHPGHMGSEPQKPEHAGGMHEHLANMHKEHGGKMMVHHHDGFEHTTHHVGEDGKVEGPQNHEDLEAVKAHMSKFFGEEQNEGDGYGGGGHHGGHESLMD